MALAQEDIQQIQLLIQKSLAETPAALNANVRYELDLRERTLRVEEQLKHQRELMIEGFKQMDKRFEQVQVDMNRRFDQVQAEMNMRFEQVEKRFEQVDKRIEQIEKRFEQVDKRFEQVEKRIEQAQSEMNKRFEQAQSEMNKRFDQQHQEVMVVHHEIKLLMRWGFGAMLAIGGLMVSMLRLVH